MAIPGAAQAQTLVVAPHPDDDIIIASGVIQRALARGEQVWVIYVTNGDRAGISVGTQRQGEAVAAQAILGQPEERLIFLGYPDAWVFDIRDRWRYPWDYTDADQPLVTPNGISSTYASRGLGRMDYHRYRFGVRGPYMWETMIGDVADALVNIRPQHIFTTSQWDTHLDHEATYFLVQAGVLQAIAAVPGYNPTIHKTTVWPGDTSWPLAADPTTPFTQIPKPAFTNRWGANPLTWPERESLDTPLAMQSTFFPGNPKFNAISAHASQGGMDEYIGRWLHQDEFFWTEQMTGTNRPPVPNAGVGQQVSEGVDVTLDGRGSFDPDLTPLTYLWRQVAGPAVTLTDPTAAQPTFFSPVGLTSNVTLAFELVVSDGALTSVPDAVAVVVRSNTPPPTYGPNLAPAATITASSQRTATAQTASKVADGSPLGYPVDPTHEWSTSGQGVGAWLTMTWSEPVSISKIVLYDRPNTGDQLTAGVITFSDASTLPIGPLVNIGSAVEYVFPARTITSLRLDVTGVSGGTGNVGLAEFEVFEVGGINRPPIANAGPNQTVASGAQVTLNGTASRDPNNDALSFTWSQISGTAVSLSNPVAASPAFSAPEATPGAQLMRFQLVVSDGEFSSAPDLVDILVPGTANSLPTASAGPDQTVSADSTVTLDGSATDLDGQPLTYLWTQIAGTPVTLPDPTAARPTFTLPVTAIDEVLTFRFVAHDGVAPSAPDTVDIRVIALPSAASNIAPAATVTASSQRAPLQAAIKAIDGFTDGFPTNSGHEWATQNQLAGAWLQLDWTAGHVLNRVRLYDRPNLDDQVTSATLTFSDGSFINLGPLNNNGAATDVPFAPRRVRWVRFTVNTVRQGSVNIGLAEIMTFEVEGAGEDQPPVAIAGPNQTVLGGASVQLDGSASNDPDGSALIFAWTQLSGPAVALGGETTPMPFFTAPLSTRLAQVLRFQLTASDGNLSSGDVVDVTVAALPNARPVAVLGPPQIVEGGAVVQLDGSASFDADNDPLIYRWAQLAGPTVVLENGATAQPSFVAPAAQTSTQQLMFRLIVDDGLVASVAETVVITITSIPDPANIAPLATITASSEATIDQQYAVKAVDGIASGFPANTGAEWSSLHQTVGAWIQLDWPTDHTINSVRLYDRPNLTDQITAGTLLFSDGSSVTVGALPNDAGTPLEAMFNPRTVRWVRFRVDTGGNNTSAVGLAEIEVLEGTEAPPTLSIAGATVTEGGVAALDVTMSHASDRTVTVQYSTAAGTALAVQDFIAANGALTFAPGSTSQTISISTVENITFESQETFTVTLSNPINAAMAGSVAAVTINDNEAPPSFTISGVSVAEGHAGATSAIFVVRLLSASISAVTVDFTTTPGTAGIGDYTPTTGTVTFAPGVTTRTLSVSVQGDTIDEPNETFSVTLSNPVGADISEAQATGTIIDDDEAPRLAITNAGVTEGNSGIVDATFTVTLNTTSTQTVSVSYSTSNESASAPQDYVTTSGTLTFNPGVTSQTIVVPVLGDTLDEANETFTVTLSDPVNATVLGGDATGTITDDDASPAVSIADVSVAEGSGGTTTAEVTVTLSAPTGQDVSVVYATADGSAVAPGAYVAGSGTYTFSPGETTGTISVTVIADLVDEPDQTFLVNLSSPVNTTIADGQATVTIVDDEGTPELAISSATVIEGNAGTAVATLTVSLSAASGQTVSVNYATANGTAVAPGDYAAASGTLTFAPGTTSQTVTINVAGDVVDEATESFVVNLSSPVNAPISEGQGVVTVTDDDGVPVISIGDAAITEGNAGTTTALFTVTLDQTSTQAVTVNYATANGSATAPQDYTAISGTLTFAPGQTSQTISVLIVGDLIGEGNETFAVNLSAPVSATIADGQGIGAINDDEPLPTLAVSDVTVTEANTTPVNAVFTVTLSAPSGQAVTVNYATANQTATSGSDYTAGSGTLTFTPGVTSRTVTIPVLGDVLVEASETFALNLTVPSGATLADAQGIGTITDNDATRTLAVSDVTVTEANTSTVSAVFTVTLSAISGQSVTVNYATANQTATSGSDYTAASGTLTFTPGATSRTITIPVLADLVDEANETFALNLTAPSGATLADAQGIGTITDNDAAPALSVSNVTVTEANTSSVNATFTVTLSATSGQSVTVNYATANQTATSGSDYTAASGTLTFTPGATSRTVTVTVLGDVLDEVNETFALNLTAPAGATLADGQGVATINDDDATPTLRINDVTVAELNTGSVNATFTVTLSTISGRTVTVNYATANGSATAPQDFTAASGQLSFAPGATTRTITIPVLGDLLDESNETYVVNLTAPAGATLLDAQGVGTITDNDATPSISITDRTITEGDTGSLSTTMTVSLSAPSGQVVRVVITSANGTATASQDYVGGSGTVTFSPGTTSQNVTATIIGDLIDEVNETAFANLSSPVNATIADAQGVLTITDNDPLPTMSINSVSLTEPDSGTVNLNFTVSLSRASGKSVTVNYATANGSASAPSDYSTRSGTLTFPAGTATMTIAVPVVGNTTRESNETFFVNLSGASNATLTVTRGTGTIINDD